MSENILKELCNKVLSLFKQTEKDEENAKDVACNRLRVVLMQDRTNLTPELLQRMRKELVVLLSKYLEMDKEALELNLEQDGDQMALMLSIPVIRAKDEEEIEQAIEEEDQAEQSKEDDGSESEEEDSDEPEGEEDSSDEDSSDDETSEETEEDEVEEDKIPDKEAKSSEGTKKPKSDD